ncbi:MAG TPA: MarR family transcriptional regulator [Woeseiaceae bacterium]|jgi:DNA-binding MarR family transcriptional regulator|nr:MarR family transcriptional regulator [Woeseiaceae bacterium]
MDKDAIDDILDQWSIERPELDTAALGVVIRVMTLNRRFAREAARALEALGLELFEYDVLSALRRQGKPFALPATALARETDLSAGAMTNRIDRLEERGLVERKPDATDRRSVIVRLTRKGIEVIDEAIHVRLKVARESLAELGKADLNRLAALLRAVVLGDGD